MSKYKVLNPIALGGRKERGEIVDVPGDLVNSFIAAGCIEPYKGEKPATNEPAEKSLEDMNASELKDKAKELELSASGSKEDLLERISLHLAGSEDQEDEEEE